MLYYNVGTGTVMVRPWLDFFPAELPNFVLFMLILCVLVPGLNSGRLAVVIMLSIITGLDYWNGVLEWSTGLTFFALNFIFMTL